MAQHKPIKDPSRPNNQAHPQAARRQDLIDWLDSLPEGTNPTKSELMAQFPFNGVTVATSVLKAWRLRKGYSADVKTKADPNSNSSRNARRGANLDRASVERLDPSDRERILRTTRNGHAFLDNMMERLRRRIESLPPDELPLLDRDTGQTMLSIQKMTSGLVDTHPGLLELAEKDGSKAPDEKDLKEILEASGVDVKKLIKGGNK